jgi:hypothetical protein
MEMHPQIINRLYEALEVIDAPLDLLQIVGSWGNTVSGEETLRQLEDFITRTTSKPSQAAIESGRMTLEELDQQVRAVHRRSGLK